MRKIFGKFTVLCGSCSLSDPLLSLSNVLLYCSNMRIKGRGVRGGGAGRPNILFCNREGLRINCC